MAVSLTTMYAPQNNGPHTALAETINAAQTDITVADASILPTAPNVLTIGTGEDAELVLMSAKTGNIITVTRGYNGTAAKSWETDEWVYRAITAQDVSALQANVNAINAGKVDAESGKGLSSNDYTSAEKQKLAGIAAGANNYVHPSTHPASMITGLADVATSGDYADLSGKPTIPTVDSAITQGGTNPVTGGAIFDALEGKVDAESGKGLSTNDYTSAEKQKLAGIAENANNYTHPATHPASMIAAGTLAGQVKANATAAAALDTAQVRSIRAGTADLTPGESALASGEVYLVYE